MKMNKINEHDLHNYLQLFLTTYTELKFLKFFIILSNFVLLTKKIFWTSVQIMLIRMIIDIVFGQTRKNDYKP